MFFSYYFITIQWINHDFLWSIALFKTNIIYLFQPSYCVNQIDEVCKVIEQTINQIVQNTLNTLETDAEYAHKLLDVHITTDDENREKNKQTTGKGI